MRNVTRESEADFRKRPCGKQPREDERSEVKFGFGSKVRGRKTRDAKKNRRKAICRRFFVAERDSRKRGGLSKAPLRQAAERRRAQRCQIRIRLESPRPQDRACKRKTAAKQFAGGFPVAGIAHPPGRANPKHVKGPDRGFKSQETDNGYSPTMAWR